MQHWQISGAVQTLCTDIDFFEIHTVPRAWKSEPCYLVYHREYDNSTGLSGKVLAIFHSESVFSARVWSRLRAQAIRADRAVELSTYMRQDVLRRLHELEKKQDRYKIYGD